MKYKNLIQEQMKAASIRTDTLLEAFNSNKISKEDSIRVLTGIGKALELIENTLSLEEQSYYSNDNSMMNKHRVQEQAETASMQTRSLISALSTSKISKEDSLVMVRRIKNTLEIIKKSINSEDQNIYTNDTRK
jgi:hypothetical protein